MKNGLGFTLSVYKQVLLDDGAAIGLDRDCRLTVQPNLRTPFPSLSQRKYLSANLIPIRRAVLQGRTVQS